MTKIRTLTLLLLLALPFLVRAQMVTNGDPAIIGAHGLTTLVVNDNSTGTFINLLAKVTATGAIRTTTSDTTISVRIVIGGAGLTASGPAQLLVAGQGPCIMDATNASGAAGWFVIESVTTNGRCHAQASAPSGGWVIGTLVDDATTSGSTANVLAGAYFSPGSGTGSVTSVATTAPIAGGTITTAGTITCPTCSTSAAAITDLSLAMGSGGGQGLKSVAGFTTDGVSILTLGVAGASVGEVDFKNATSGTIAVKPVAGALGSVVLSLPATTGTLAITSGNVATATALAANGSNCSAGSYPLGVDASGVSETCTDYGTETKTFTNKTLDVEGTGNVITAPFKVWLPTAGCNNATAGAFWDLPTATPAVAACVTGTNIQKGVLQYADTTGGFSAQTTLILPADFSGAIDARIIWRTSATTGNAKFSLSTICTDVAATATDDPAFNTASTVTTAAPGTTLRIQSSSITGVTATGCVAGNLLHLKLFRDGNDGSDTISASLDVLGVELTFRRAM